MTLAFRIGLDRSQIRIGGTLHCVWKWVPTGSTPQRYPRGGPFNCSRRSLNDPSCPISRDSRGLGTRVLSWQENGQVMTHPMREDLPRALSGPERCSWWWVPKDVLGDGSDKTRGQRDVVMKAVIGHGLALAFASEELQGDREIVMNAITPRIWRYGLVASCSDPSVYQKRPCVHNSVCSQFLEGLFVILAECSQFCLRSF